MRRTLIAFLLLGAIGLGIFTTLYDTVFPTAALRPEITRRRAEEIAVRYLGARGFEVGAYKRATFFTVHDDEANFLERTWGIERFNEEIRRNSYLAPWRFESRFFRPLQKEEFSVGVNTEGRVTAFHHLVEETAPGAHLTKEEARARAEAFLRNDIRVDPAQYEEKEYHEGKLAARTDHEFTYELKNSQIFRDSASQEDADISERNVSRRQSEAMEDADISERNVSRRQSEAMEDADISERNVSRRQSEGASKRDLWRGRGSEAPEDTEETGSERLGVLVQGDAVGAFERFVFVPESFTRSRMEEDASGTLYVIIAGLAQIILLIGGFTALLKGYKQNDLHSAPFYWIAGALVVLSLVSAFGSFDELSMAYPTTTPWNNYIAVSILILIAVVAVTTVIEALVAGIAGERLTRAVFPHANDLGRSAARDPGAVWTAALIGMASGLIFLGYVAVFYYVGTRYLGIWSPIAPEITSYMGSGIPFLVPFALSLVAAVTEELTFRYLGVSLLKRYAKHTVLALIVPAMIWAFLHSTYPVYPLYARGVELTIAGIFLGYLFIRYGILTVVVAHYTINAVLFSVPLLRSGDAYLRASGTMAVGLVVAIPIAYILATRRKIRFSLRND
jgi:hypothetical protein